MPIQSKDTVNERYRTRMFIEVYIKSKNIQFEYQSSFPGSRYGLFCPGVEFRGPSRGRFMSLFSRPHDGVWVDAGFEGGRGEAVDRHRARHQLRNNERFFFISAVSFWTTLALFQVRLKYVLSVCLYRFCRSSTTWKMFNLHHACNKTCIETS